MKTKMYLALAVLLALGLGASPIEAAPPSKGGPVGISSCQIIDQPGS